MSSSNIRSRGDGAIPVALFNDTRVDRHHGCSRVVEAIEQLLEDNGMTLAATSPAHEDWSLNEQFLARSEKCQLFIVNGEGTIHHDRPEGLALIKVADHARSHGVPSALINCGWDHNTGDGVAGVAHFSLVSARDSDSATQIRATGASCRVVPDLSMYSSAPADAGIRSGTAFTDSVVRRVAIDLEKLRGSLGGASLPIQFSELGCRGAYRFHREYVGLRDLAAPVDLWSMLSARHAQYRGQLTSSEAFLRSLASFELLVTGRYHACTMAIVARTPFLAVTSNSRKIESLVADVGLESWRVQSSVGSLRDNMLGQYAWRAGELAAIDAYLALARSEARRLFSDIRNLA